MAESGLALPPFRHLRPVLAVTAGYLLATLVWLAAGGWLPGGRWFAVHLFTLGVVTNLVAALSHHFAQTLLHAGRLDRIPGRLVLLNVGVVTLLAARVGGSPWLFAAGAGALVGAVAWLYLDLRRRRKASLTGRFTSIVRIYERACSAFFHGALLGALLGVGLLAGGWYGAARLAHLHVNVLGWGGLTLLATVVFFGPTMMRVRLEPGAAAAAPRALRHGATGLSVGVLALLATGWDGGFPFGFRLLAAAGLAVYAGATVVVCWPVLRAAGRADPAPHTFMISAACGWFILAVWADVILVAGGWTWLLDAVGVALLAGVLGQAILAALNYLAPMVLVAGMAARTSARNLFQRAAGPRAVAFNAGVAAMVASVPAARAGFETGWMVAAGTLTLATAVIAQVAVLLWVRLRFPQVGWAGEVSPRRRVGAERHGG